MNKPILLSILALELILCDFYILGAVVALTALEIHEKVVNNERNILRND